ncbi:unnamed protein product, partial [marine sediment metagenome]
MIAFLSWFKRKEKKSYVTKNKGVLYKRQRKKLHKITYRQEMVTDGKSNKLYGPYWYGYYREEGKLHKIYIGKQRKEVKLG